MNSLETGFQPHPPVFSVPCHELDETLDGPPLSADDSHILDGFCDSPLAAKEQLKFYEKYNNEERSF